MFTDEKISLNMQAERKPYGTTPLSRNTFVIMYDLECDQKTGIPFLITFCLFNCALKLFVDCMGIDRRYDKGIPVFYVYKSKYHTIYAIFRKLLETVANVGPVFLMAYNGNAFDHLYMVNGFKYKYCIVSGNSIKCMDFVAYNVRYHLRDKRDYITTGNLAPIGDMIDAPKLTTGLMILIMQ